MKWDQLTGQLEMLCPKQAALDFDNVGLLVGRKDKEIEKVYLAVDALDEVIEDAIHWGACLLYTSSGTGIGSFTANLSGD